MSTICIIQARMASTRLPGKILQPILNKPMLSWVVSRVQQCRLIDNVVVATTTEPQDDAVASLCLEEGWLYYRGSQDDVLDRYYQAAKQFQAEHIVRITSDCPLIDPSVSDYTLALYHSAMPIVDYASNLEPRTYPRGLDTEIFSFLALEESWKQAKLPRWREHVTLYIREQIERFSLLHVTNPVDYSAHRWTVDTAQDMELVRRIYDHFGHGNFGWRDVLKVLLQFPEWVKLNKDIQQKMI